MNMKNFLYWFIYFVATFILQVAWWLIKSVSSKKCVFLHCCVLFVWMIKEWLKIFIFLIFVCFTDVFFMSFFCLFFSSLYHQDTYFSCKKFEPVHVFNQIVNPNWACMGNWQLFWLHGSWLGRRSIYITSVTTLKVSNFADKGWLKLMRFHDSLYGSQATYAPSKHTPGWNSAMFENYSKDTI